MMRTETQSVEVPIFGFPRSYVSQADLELAVVQAVEAVVDTGQAHAATSRLIITMERTYDTEIQQ